MFKQLSANPLGQDAVVLVVDADTDDGYRIARELLCAGCRVTATAHCPADLVRIMHGYGADRVLAVAADMHDDKQRQRVIARVERQFGHIDAMLCARLSRCPQREQSRARYLIGTVTGDVLYPATRTQLAAGPFGGTTPRISTVSPGNTVT